MNPKAERGVIFLLLNYSIKILFLIKKNGIIELDLQPLF